MNSKIFFLALSFFSLVSCQKNEQPRLKDGYLDLRNSEYCEKEICNLYGNWFFEKDQFLESNDRLPKNFASVPSASLESKTYGIKTSMGIGTYQIILKLRPNHKPMKLLFTEVGSSAKFFINGLEVSKLGEPSSIEEKNVSDIRLISFEIPNSLNEIKLTVQVANFLRGDCGGIIRNVYLGEKDQIERKIHVDRILDGVLIGFFIFLGIYHIFVFLTYRNQILNLSIFVYSVWGSFATLVGDGKVIEFVQFGSIDLMLRLIYGLGTLAATGILFNIVTVFKEESNQTFTKFIYALTIGMSICYFFLPFRITSLTASSYSYSFVITYLYCLYILLKAILNRRRYAIVSFVLNISIILFVIYVVIVFGILNGPPIMATTSTLFFLFYILSICFLTFYYYSRDWENVLLQKENEIRMKEIQISEEKWIQEGIFKTKLFTIISHDLRGPIKNLKLLFNIRKTRPRHIPVERFDREIENSILEVDKMLEELLTWSSRQIDKDELEFSEINLKEFINEIVSELENVLKLNKFRIQFKIEKNLRAVLDKNLTRIIMRNLLTNSIKYSKDENLVLIHAYKQENEIFIGVKDHGIGLSKEIQKKLFKGLIQKDLSSEKYIQGFGVGLMLCKEFAQKQGGDLIFDSSQKRGATFILKIPI